MKGVPNPITIDGESLLLHEWCARTGVPPSTAWQRILRGWDRALAVTAPPMDQRERRRLGRASFERARAEGRVGRPRMDRERACVVGCDCLECERARERRRADLAALGWTPPSEPVEPVWMVALRMRRRPNDR